MPDETKAQAETATEPKKEEKKVPTLESLQEEMNRLKEESEKVRKQNSDKDSFITTLQRENRGLRENIEKVQNSLSGKTETQKDAILETQRKKFLDKGYDQEQVDLILGAITEVSEYKHRVSVAPIITDAVEGLLESDSDIDRAFYEKNQEAIWSEYDLFKPEQTPRKIKANLKRAYNAVRDRTAEGERKSSQAKSREERDSMISGSTPPPASSKKALVDDTKDFLESIEKAGGEKSRYF